MRSLTCSYGIARLCLICLVLTIGILTPAESSILNTGAVSGRDAIAPGPQTDFSRNAEHQPHGAVGLSIHPRNSPLSNPSSSDISASSIPPANYDEQLGMTFTQSLTSATYNVTAVAQSDANGYGPAYLLNGLTSSGYWYQVGVAYDWPYTAGGYNSGFNLIYDVFDSRGVVVLPSGGGGGLSTFSGPVNSGDSVRLNLYFKNGDVIMFGRDWATGANATVSYSAQGRSSFVGSPSAISDSNGFFTGLMTEWYHADPYNNYERKVVYSNFGFELSSAWMWIDEYNPSDRTWTGAFSANTSSPVAYKSNPNTLQSFSSHGGTMSSDAYEFVTVSTGCGTTSSLNADVLACNGIGPTTIGLRWGTSGYPLWGSYEVQQSNISSRGPWTTIDTITSKSNTTEYIRNLTPGEAHWWRMIDHAAAFVSVTSNVLQITQPDVSTLSYIAVTDTVYRFSWDNNANYTGPVSLDSYSLMESVNGGDYSVAFSTSSESTRSYTINSLSSTTAYSFYVVTTDKCGSCPSQLSSSSNSSKVDFQTPDTLVASVIAQPGQADVGQTVSFTCNAHGGVSPYGFSWSLGDGLKAEGSVVVHSYSSSGIMNVVCLVTDSLSTSAAGSISTAISSDPFVSVPTASPPSADVGQNLEFVVRSGGGYGTLTYSWTNLPPGCSSIDSTAFLCQPTMTGIFLVSASVTDSNGFTVVSGSLSFIAYSDPSVNALTSSRSALDLGQTVTFQVSVSGGSGGLSYSYAGLPPGCGTTNSASLTCMPSATGTYSITASATDSNAFTSTGVQLSITVNPDPIVSITASSSVIDKGQTIKFTASANGGTGPLSFSYEGLPSECPSSNSTRISCSPAKSGGYTVTVIVTDHAGMSAKSSVSVDVNFSPQVTGFSPSAPSTYVGEAITLTVSVTAGTTPLSYSYSGLPPGCSSTDSPTLTCTPSTSGVYVVRVNVRDQAGQTATSSVNMTVNPAKVLGLPATEGYSVIGGVIAAVAAVAIAATVLTRKRRARSKISG